MEVTTKLYTQAQTPQGTLPDTGLNSDWLAKTINEAQKNKKGSIEQNRTLDWWTSKTCDGKGRKTVRYENGKSLTTHSVSHVHKISLLHGM